MGSGCYGFGLWGFRVLRVLFRIPDGFLSKFLLQGFRGQGSMKGWMFTVPAARVPSRQRLQGLLEGSTRVPEGLNGFGIWGSYRFHRGLINFREAFRGTVYRTCIKGRQGDTLTNSNYLDRFLRPPVDQIHRRQPTYQDEIPFE